jgi:hypothetical protein
VKGERRSGEEKKKDPSVRKRFRSRYISKKETSGKRNPEESVYRAEIMAPK